MELIGGDRRGHRRYEVDLELRFKVLGASAGAAGGAGKALNMSSGGVLVEIDQELREGAAVELAIEWPFLLQNVCPLTLKAVGTVVRSREKRAAIRTRRYEFVTRGTRSFDELGPALRGGVLA
jgi:hypothetical protein